MIMPCECTESCAYYNIQRYKSTSRQERLLVESYCEGRLQSMCRRRLYEEEFCHVAPDNLAPNGYLVGTHVKLRIENTRQHKRYEVKNGTCLLQDPSNQKTFSADVIDVSDGGLRLVTNVEPQLLKNGAQKTTLKILGHSIEDCPIAVTKEFINIVWQKDEIMGCAFSPSAA